MLPQVELNNRLMCVMLLQYISHKVQLWYDWALLQHPRLQINKHWRDWAFGRLDRPRLDSPGFFLDHRDRLEQVERQRERDRKLREQQKEQRELKERERRAEERRKERDGRREGRCYTVTPAGQEADFFTHLGWSQTCAFPLPAVFMLS